MRFFRWLGFSEGGELRAALFAIVMLLLLVAGMEFRVRNGPIRQIEDDWQTLRACGGDYWLRRDPEGQLWRTNGYWRNRVDKDSAEEVCPRASPKP